MLLAGKTPAQIIIIAATLRSLFTFDFRLLVFATDCLLRCLVRGMPAFSLALGVVVCMFVTLRQLAQKLGK